MRAVYTGHETLTFSDYTDLDTGRTLTAVPGRVYDVAPAGGRPVPEIPAGWFTPAYGAQTPARLAEPQPEPEAAPEPEPEPGPVPDGEPEEPQPEEQEQPAE